MIDLLITIFFLLTAAITIIVFRFAKSTLKLPMIINLPGAVLCFLAGFQFSGWLAVMLFPLFDADPPDVRWYGWLVYLTTTILWYIAAIRIRSSFAGGKFPTK